MTYQAAVTRHDAVVDIPVSAGVLVDGRQLTKYRGADRTQLKQPQSVT